MLNEIKKLNKIIKDKNLNIIISKLEKPFIKLDLIELKSLISPNDYDFPNTEVGEIALEDI